MASGLANTLRSEKDIAAVSRPELGTKRSCPSCGAKFYDLSRSPIVCPKCGHRYEADAPLKRVPSAVAAERKPAVVVAPAVQTAAAEEGPPVEEPVVSLEEADKETSDAPRSRAAALDEDEEVEIESEVENDEEADDTLLEEEDEYGDDDVATIIDADLEDDD